MNRVIAAVELCFREIRCVDTIHITDGDAVARRRTVRCNVLGIAAVDLALDRAALDDDIVVVRRGLAPAARDGDAVRTCLYCAIYGTARVRELHLAVRRAALDRIRTIKCPCHRAAAHANGIFDCFVRSRLLNHAFCMTAVEFARHRATVHLDDVVEYTPLALAGIGVPDEVDVVDGERIARHICGRRRLAARRYRAIHIGESRTRLDQFTNGEMIARYRAFQQVCTDDISVRMRRRSIADEPRIIHPNRRTLVI